VATDIAARGGTSTTCSWFVHVDPARRHKAYPLPARRIRTRRQRRRRRHRGTFPKRAETLRPLVEPVSRSAHNRSPRHRSRLRSLVGESRPTGSAPKPHMSARQRSDHDAVRTARRARQGGPQPQRSVVGRGHRAGARVSRTTNIVSIVSIDDCWYLESCPLPSPRWLNSFAEPRRTEPVSPRSLDAILGAPTTPQGTLAIAAHSLNDNAAVRWWRELSKARWRQPKVQHDWALRSPHAVHRASQPVQLLGSAVGNQTYFSGLAIRCDRVRTDLPPILELLSAFTSDPLLPPGSCA